MTKDIDVTAHRCSLSDCPRRAVVQCDVTSLVTDLAEVEAIFFCSDHAFEHLAAASLTSVNAPEPSRSCN